MLENVAAAKHVLVVDDDRLICWALAQELSVQALDVSMCHDGTEALARLREGSYDLVILDVHLPDADGIAITEEVRKRSPGTRVIVVSADADPGNIRRAVAAGAEEFLEKPFDLAKFRSRVLGMLRDYPSPRRHARHLCRIPVRMSLLSPVPPAAAFEADALNGTAEDVGGGGLRVATGFPLAPGQVVRVTPTSAGSADPFLHLVPAGATAEVRWTAMSPAGFSAGLSFRRSRPRPEASPAVEG